MLKNTSSKENRKLIPLRRIAEESSYSAAYLSILVQRKKLKAKRVGRNYFTTRNWFADYLETHARDDKRADSKNIKKVESFDVKKDVPSSSVLSTPISNKKVVKVVTKKEAKKTLKTRKGFLSLEEDIIREQRSLEQLKKEEEIVFGKEKKVSPKVITSSPKFSKTDLNIKVVKKGKRFLFLPTLLLSGVGFFVSLISRSVFKILLSIIFFVSYLIIIPLVKDIDSKIKKIISPRVLKFSYSSLVLIFLLFIFGKTLPATSTLAWNKVDSLNSKVKNKLVKDTWLGDVLQNKKIKALKENIFERNKRLANKLGPVKNEFNFISSYWKEIYDNDVKRKIVGNDVKSKDISRAPPKVQEKKSSSFLSLSKDKLFAFFKGIKNVPKKAFASVKNFIIPETEKTNGRVAGVSEVNLEQSGRTEDSEIKKSLWVFIKDKSTSLLDMLNEKYKVAFGIMNPVEVDESFNDVYRLKKEEEKEGVVVVPFENDEEALEMKAKIETMFSDDVVVAPDDSGRAGIVKPVFGAKEVDQKYLYMMVPLNEENK